MSERGKGLIGIVLIILLPTAAGAVDLWQQGTTSLTVTGYYKNLLSHSETLFPRTEPFLLDLNRLRLELQGKWSDRAVLDIQYDHEVFLGSYLKTEQFKTQKGREPDTYRDLENAYWDRSSIYARQLLYRGYLTVYSPYTDVTVGRQRIAWGTAYFWNPTDLLNPFNPIQLERDERAGVDAVLAEANLGALSRLSLVYAPHDHWETSSLASRVRTNMLGFDLAAMGGWFREDWVVGGDFAGSIQQVGVRGEAAFTAAEGNEDFLRAVAGADYTFSNTLLVVVEYYYNGQGQSQKQDYEFSRLFSGELLNLARQYLGAIAGYDLTPLLRWDNYAILNLNDGSLYFSPNLTYSVMTNLDWALGPQLFVGSDGSEYGTYSNRYTTQLQWFF